MATNVFTSTCKPEGRGELRRMKYINNDNTRAERKDMEAGGRYNTHKTMYPNS
jgi:hypothetical protein